MPRLLSDDEASEYEDAQDDAAELDLTRESRSESRVSARNSDSREVDNEEDVNEIEVPVEPEEDKEDEDDNVDLGEEVFIVEAIKNHIFQNGVLKFQIKWEGYSKKSDMTWEPEENLSEAREIVAEYFEKLGGRDAVMGALGTLKPATKKRGRKAVTEKITSDKSTSGKRQKKDSGSPHPAMGSPPPVEWTPPEGNWEDHIKSIDTIFRDPVTNRLMAAVTWNAAHQSHKTSHATQLLYRRCPQKMLKFYEGHLTFKNTEHDDESYV